MGVEIDGVNNKIDFDDDKDTSISSSSDDVLVFEAGGTNTMHIINGKVGIGTSSPAKHLSLKTDGGGAAVGIDIHNQGTDNADDALITFETQGHRNFSLGIDRSESAFVVMSEADGLGTPRITVDDDGNVGIGESSPDSRLHVNETIDVAYSVNDFTLDSNVLLKLENPSTTSAAFSAMQFRTGSGADLFFGGVQGSGNRGEFVFARQDATDVELLRINADGNLLLGTSSYAAGQTAKLLQPSQIFSTRSVTGQAGHISFQNPNGGVGTITTSGSPTTYSTSSDYRLKENVNYDFDATTELKKLKPAKFNFKADPDTTLEGFLAHEVSDIVPIAVTGKKDELEVWEADEKLPDDVSVGDNKLDDSGNTIPKYQGIDQSKLVPLLVKTVQELEARITELENA